MPQPRSEFLHQLGLQLRALRVAQGRTQEDVAERAGYTGKYVSEVERGLRDLPLTTLERLATYGVDTRIDQIFGAPDGHELPVDPLADLPHAVRQVAVELAGLPDKKRRQVLALVRDVIALSRA